MSRDVTLHGKRAVKVNAETVMWGVSEKAQLFNIDGEERWVPKSLSEYNEKEKTLIIEEWFYNKIFKDGKNN
jgi:hypothetical protein